LTDPTRNNADSGSTRPSIEPGTVIDGKYRVERVIGEGGMGVVVAATHLQLDQRVAIKALLPAALEHAQSVERFAREARVTAKITSEHVARVFDVGALADGSPYMVMEYLEGKDLKDLVRENGPLPIDEACEIALQACEALAAAHAAGIIHRDLKPANLFVTRRADGSPNVKLLDFGISKFTVHPDDPRLDPSMTSTTMVMGSPGYMSPEQMKSTRDVDERADIWALGTVLYEVLTGRPAFVAETMAALIAVILSEYPTLPSALRDDVPIALERALLRCLEKKPEDRFANVGELAQVLAEYAPERAVTSLQRIGATLGDASLPVVSVRSAPMRAADEPNDSRADAPRKRGLGYAALLGLFAAGVAVVVWKSDRLDWGAAAKKVVGTVDDSQLTPSAAAPASASSSIASSVSSIPSAPSAAPPTPASAASAIAAPDASASLDASSAADAALAPDDDDAGADDDAGDDDDAGPSTALAADASSVAPAPHVTPAPRAQPPPRRRHPKPPQRPPRKTPPRRK
jgi:serine/threonine-protein kinase